MACCSKPPSSKLSAGEVSRSSPSRITSNSASTTNRGSGLAGTRGEGAGLELVVRTGSRDPAALPCDLLQAGRRLSFGLDDLFPAFSYPVVASLDRSDLDALHRAQERHRPGRLGEDATRDFVLRHVFDFAPELVRRPSDLLRLLLRRHYRGQRLPRLLDDRLVQLLRQSGAFTSWPLTTIVPDRGAFFAFLQERWPLFLDRLMENTGGQRPARGGRDARPRHRRTRGPALRP